MIEYIQSLMFFSLQQTRSFELHLDWQFIVFRNTHWFHKHGWLRYTRTIAFMISWKSNLSLSSGLSSPLSFFLSSVEGCTELMGRRWEGWSGPERLAVKLTLTNLIHYGFMGGSHRHRKSGRRRGEKVMFSIKDTMWPLLTTSFIVLHYGNLPSASPPPFQMGQM